VIQPVIDAVRSDAEQKNIVIAQFFPDKTLTARCDPDLMRIVFSNLMSNAIKYGRNDSDIRIELAPVADGFSISVTNEGPGFPKSEIPNLFKKYSRLQTPELIRQKGTGLGLYTVWRIVKLHRGNIHADSEQGSWARFTVDIPSVKNE
jgi:signal transduction histidine kinase